MPGSDDPLVMAPAAARPLAEQVAQRLGVPLAPCEERWFEDGELKIRPLTGVRGRDVYLFGALYGEPGQSVHDRLCQMLFLIGAVRDASARTVSLIAPYLPYARKDRRTKPRDPVTSRYLAQLLEAVGVDRVVALEVHNPAAFDNAFRCRAEHVETGLLLARALRPHIGDRPLTVVSPDPGGAKRADRLRAAFAGLLGAEPPLAFVEKHRSGGVVSGELLVGEVAGRVAVIVDDLISSGETLLRAARACRAQGASAVLAAVTHGLFAPGAEALLAAPELDRLIVTDSVPARLPPPSPRLQVVPLAPLLAEVVAALHLGGSLTELLEV